MLKGESLLDSPLGQQIVHAKNMKDVCAAFDVSPVPEPMPRLGESFTKKPRVEQ